MDKATQEAVRHGKYIADSMQFMQRSIQRAMQRKPEPLHVEECDLCHENGEGTVKDEIELCDDCHQQEIA